MHLLHPFFCRLRFPRQGKTGAVEDLTDQVLSMCGTKRGTGIDLFSQFSDL